MTRARGAAQSKLKEAISTAHTFSPSLRSDQMTNAAKLAQQEKLAARGYGELGATCMGDACRGNVAKANKAAAEKAKPKTFAEQLDFAVRQSP